MSSKRARPSLLRRLAGHAFLALFLVRALIPAGYMPDFGALAHGVVKAVICTSAGVKVLTLDANGIPVPDAPDDQDNLQCVFGGLASLAVSQGATAFVYARLKPFQPSVPETFGLPPVRAGPTLGSRAPPVFP